MPNILLLLIEGFSVLHHSKLISLGFKLLVGQKQEDITFDIFSFLTLDEMTNPGFLRLF